MGIIDKAMGYVFGKPEPKTPAQIERQKEDERKSKEMDAMIEKESARGRKVADDAENELKQWEADKRAGRKPKPLRSERDADRD
jgi:hypothetical protein